jgi:hypothetical protein
VSELLDKNARTVSEHIGNVFKEGELDESSVIRNFRITASDGKSYDTQFYNLDVIISVGYRVKSKRGTQFRIWATQTLKVHLTRGYTVNRQRLEENAKLFVGYYAVPGVPVGRPSGRHVGLKADLQIQTRLYLTHFCARTSLKTGARLTSVLRGSVSG